MPPIPVVVESLDKVPEAARGYYEQREGKYHLTVDGTPAGFVTQSDHATQVNKVSEFRNNNVALQKEVDELRPLKTKFDGIDPEQAKKDRATVIEFEKKGAAKPDDISTQITTAVQAAVKPLQDQITASNASLAAERKRADDSLFRSEVGTKFVKAGGQPNATDFIVGKAHDTFEIKDGVLVAKANKFSTDNPGEPIQVEEWLKGQTKESDFAFKPSGGAGADNKGGGGQNDVRPGQTILWDPTPAQLGENADKIRKGEVVVRSRNAQ